MASYPYWEQVGVNRQAGGVTLDTVPWYSLIVFRARRFNIFDQQTGAAQQLYYDAPYPVKISFDYAVPCNKYYIPALFNIQQSHIFLQQSFDTISDCSLAYFLGNRESNSRCCQAVGGRLDHE